MSLPRFEPTSRITAKRSTRVACRGRGKICRTWSGAIDRAQGSAEGEGSLLALSAPSPVLRRDQYVTRKALERALLDVGKFIGGHVKPLVARIEQLEATSLRDRASGARLGTYGEGDVVTDRGSAWVCQRAPHGARPGESDAWRLLFKTEHPRKEQVMTDKVVPLLRAQQESQELDPELVEMGREACMALFGGCTVGRCAATPTRATSSNSVRRIKLVRDTERRCALALGPLPRCTATKIWKARSRHQLQRSPFARYCKRDGRIALAKVPTTSFRIVATSASSSRAGCSPCAGHAIAAEAAAREHRLQLLTWHRWPARGLSSTPSTGGKDHDH